MHGDVILSAIRKMLIRFRKIDPLITQWKRCLSTFFDIYSRYRTLSIGLHDKRRCLIDTSKLSQIVGYSDRLTHPGVFHTSVDMHSARR